MKWSGDGIRRLESLVELSSSTPFRLGVSFHVLRSLPGERRRFSSVNDYSAMVECDASRLRADWLTWPWINGETEAVGAERPSSVSVHHRDGCLQRPPPPISGPRRTSRRGSHRKTMWSSQRFKVLFFFQTHLYTLSSFSQNQPSGEFCCLIKS